jgi:two-component system NtrC family sensor kinase
VRSFSNQPLRRQIIECTLVMLLLYAVVTVWAASRTRADREAEVRREAASAAVTAAANIEQYFAGLDSLAAGLVREPAVRALDRAACDALFADLLPTQAMVLNIVLVDGKGQLYGSGMPTAYAAHQTVNWPVVAQVMESGRPALTAAQVDHFNGVFTTTLAYPVRQQDGRMAGVLAIGVNLAHLQTLFASIPLVPGSSVTLADRSSRMLARYPEKAALLGTAIGSTPAEPRDVPMSVERVGVDGVARFYGNAVVTRPGWLLSVGIPTSEASARAWTSLRRNLTIAILVNALIALMAIWGAHLISGGLNRLRTAAQRIADGDLSPPRRSATPTRELSQLQEAFITMAANLRETHGALDRQVEQERKMRETLQSLQLQVVRQERLAAVGVLVSGVAHELNNPLQAILGTLELLERDRAISPAVLEEIAFVKTQSGRAREIIRNLSRFSSQQSGPPTLVDLREVIDEVVQLRRRDLDTCGIVLSVDIQTDRKVYANFTEVEQVTLNFVINAQQSLEAAEQTKGRILIRVHDAGKRVRLEVQDDGPGVTPEDEPKLFQPFFTTKPVGKGTGLGLSVSYGIIDSYGGTIGQCANDWGGATFFFELPVSEPAARPPSSSTKRASSKPDDRPPLLHRPVSPGI